MKRQFLQMMTILVFGLMGIMFTSCGGDDDASSGDNGTGVLADVEINEKNFPDGIFRNWLLSQDYGSDGVLTKSEIARVTLINAQRVGSIDSDHNGKIQSLRGIEYFTALETLACCLNELTELDVSKNTALKELACFSNKLTELNLSKNTALTKLACYSNEIRDKSMDALVASLPTVKSGELLVKMSNRNVMTTTQVAAAKTKGWTPYYYDSHKGWQEYAGE